jgi:hypothetical protein
MTRQSISAAAFVVLIVPQHFVTAARPGSNITEHGAIVCVSSDVAGLSADVSGNRPRSAGDLLATGTLISERSTVVEKGCRNEDSH